MNPCDLTEKHLNAVFTIAECYMMDPNTVAEAFINFRHLCFSRAIKATKLYLKLNHKPKDGCDENLLYAS